VGGSKRRFPVGREGSTSMASYPSHDTEIAKLLLDYGARPSLMMNVWKDKTTVLWPDHDREINKLMSAAPAKNKGAVQLQRGIASEAISLF
jgi:hypothetical protein